MLDALKQRVCAANRALPALGLVVFTWGNVSGFDCERGLFAIKPSGVDYDELTPDLMIVCDVNGNVVEGDLRPSSDMLTHAALYRAWGERIGGVVHTHSKAAVAWAQAGRAVPCYGTTQADYFYGEIPCTRDLTEEEVKGGYEFNTGNVIVEGFERLDPVAVPGCLVRNHGPFAWGEDAAQAVYHAKVVEECALMALNTEQLNPDVWPVPQYLLDKHFMRKHGPDAYYGQHNKRRP